MACGFPPDPVRGPTLAAVLQAGLSGSPPSLPKHHWDILNALLACRTPALGGHRYECEDCGKTHFVPHSCRNRHCPVCQGQAAHQWLEKQEGSLLPVPYFHLVFTLPHVLNPVIQQNQAVLYRLLFATASQTLLEFGQNRFGVQLGITAVLHTWSQTLLDHYHLHCIVTGGGLSADGSQWVSAPAHFLFPVPALSVVFRGKFCSGLEKLFGDQQLQFHGQLAALAEPDAFKSLLREAAAKPWVVYAKKPFAGPSQVLAYLSRYTHRVAISPRRLLALDEEKQTVTFAWRDYADGGRRKTMALETKEFLRRFCLHLLPERFVKIRHYGLLANRHREERVAQARALLPPPVAPQPESPKSEEPKEERERVCPHCGSQRLILIEVVEPATASKPAPIDSS
jgi:hypothetical protein